MQEFDFLRPASLQELITTLDETRGQVIAGGTDIIPKMRRDMFSASCLVDASHINELNFIKAVNDEISIGALTTHQEMADSVLLKDANPALATAAASVGCDQTRHRGTLGGNIANASPAADTVPALLVFDARARLVRKESERVIPLREFFISPGKTKLESGELIHSVIFQRLSGAWGASFQKMGKRNGMAISIVSVAVAVVLDSSNKIEDARIALGSVAPTVTRSAEAEKMLVGQQADSEVIKEAANVIQADIAPINDVRSTAKYRRHAASVLTRRALIQSIEQAKGRMK